jgi:hypothetical protein
MMNGVGLGAKLKWDGLSGGEACEYIWWTRVEEGVQGRRRRRREGTGAAAELRWRADVHLALDVDIGALLNEALGRSRLVIG